MKFYKGLKSFSLLLALCMLLACSDADKTETVESRTPFLVLNIASGALAGEHIFTATEVSTNGFLRVVYKTRKDITLLDSKGLKAAGSGLSLQGLKKMIKGELSEGRLPATTWHANSSLVQSTCGSLELFDEQAAFNLSAITVSFLDCSPVQVDKLGDWFTSEDGTRRRWVEGWFDERVNLKTSTEGQRYQSVETNLRVDFAMWQID